MAYSAPSRVGLIRGAVLVALHGFEQVAITQARHFGNKDFMSCSDVVEARRIADAVRGGQRVQVHHDRIGDLFAHTRQTLRISYEEWEEVMGFVAFT